LKGIDGLNHFGYTHEQPPHYEGHHPRIQSKKDAATHSSLSDLKYQPNIQQNHELQNVCDLLVVLNLVPLLQFELQNQLS
jgi:hypothetical protein